MNALIGRFNLFSCKKWADWCHKLEISHLLASWYNKLVISPLLVGWYNKLVISPLLVGWYNKRISWIWQNVIKLKNNSSYVIIVAYLLSIITSRNSIFMSYFTFGTIVEACHFFVNYLNKNLTETQNITRTRTLYYEKNIIYVYGYMVAVYLLNLALNGLLWTTNIYVTHLCLLLVTPICSNYFFTHRVSLIIKNNLDNFRKFVVIKIIKKAVNLFSLDILNKPSNITSNDIGDIFERGGVNYTQILMNCLIMFLTVKLKDNISPVYYKILTSIYFYKTGVSLTNYNVESARQEIEDMLLTKKIEKLSNPNIYAAIHVLNKNRKKTSFGVTLNVYKHELDKKFQRSMMFWTLSCVISNLLFGILGYYTSLESLLVILMYFWMDRYRIGKFNYKGALLSIGLSIVIKSLPVVCMVMCFNDYFWKLIPWKLLSKLYRKNKLRVTKVWSDYRLARFHVLSFFNVTVIYASTFTSDPFVLGLIYSFLYMSDDRTRYINITILGLGMLSNYSIFHLLYINTICLLVYDLFVLIKNYKTILNFKSGIRQMSDITIISDYKQATTMPMPMPLPMPLPLAVSTPTPTLMPMSMPVSTTINQPNNRIKTMYVADYFG